MIRRDLAFPFRIVANQAAAAPYAAHVAQMVRQVLLTEPGERVNLPTFGAGLRRLLFAPIGGGLKATTELAVRQALDRWLGDQIIVRNVAVSTDEPGTIVIEIGYELIETHEEHTEALEISA